MMRKKGFTLVEVLIAISIFSLSAVIASSVLVSVVQLEKKASIQNAIYQDLRVLMQQLSNEIQNGTVDYEEYYNVKVAQSGDVYYGTNYGVYASRFYDPGQKLGGGATSSPVDLGVECSYPNPLGDDQDCEIYFTNSNDLNTGANPYNGPITDANAFCDNTYLPACDGTENIVNELYLIDNTGTKKTIIGRKLMEFNPAEYSVALVRMHGQDFDQNGIVDIFTCEEDFNCTGAGGAGFVVDDEIKYPFVENDSFVPGDNNIRLPKQSDLTETFDANLSQFIPISPRSIDIKNLEFKITPSENPYMAYAETASQMHPAVTIIITFNLASDIADDYPGEFQDLTVQTTVAAGVVGKIESYPPVNDIRRTSSPNSWIDNVL